jgi:hypothetical protein
MPCPEHVNVISYPIVTNEIKPFMENHPQHTGKHQFVHQKNLPSAAWPIGEKRNVALVKNVNLK